MIESASRYMFVLVCIDKTKYMDLNELELHQWSWIKLNEMKSTYKRSTFTPVDGIRTLTLMFLLLEIAYTRYLPPYLHHHLFAISCLVLLCSLCGCWWKKIIKLNSAVYQSPIIAPFFSKVAFCFPYYSISDQKLFLPLFTTICNIVTRYVPIHFAHHKTH